MTTSFILTTKGEELVDRLSNLPDSELFTSEKAFGNFLLVQLEDAGGEPLTRRALLGLARTEMLEDLRNSPELRDEFPRGIRLSKFSAALRGLVSAGYVQGLEGRPA